MTAIPILNPQTLERLEYGRIQDELSAYAVSYLGRRHIAALQPVSDARALRRKLDETDEAAGVLRRGASIPLPSLTGMEQILDLLGTGYVFQEQDFMHLHQFLRSCAQLIDYMRAKADWAPNAAAYASGMHRLDRLREEIERCVRGGRVLDSASRELSKVRRRMATAEERGSRRLAELMAKHRSILQESLAVQRGGRSAIPVRKEYRKLVKGTVLDESSSGQTVYIEPEEIRQFHDELELLRAEEAREETKILSELTGLAEQFGQELAVNAELVGEYDFLFAKARYALALDAVNVKLNEHGRISLRGARHPLMGAQMVPLNFELGGRFRMLIVTGPNTGGKTLALKTVGLLTLMAQSGLLIPAEEGGEIAVFTGIEADIGDGQSIQQALSTFSAHIRRVKSILETADRRTLVLIDEMASGTDPGEGVGLSIAVLEELHRRGACVVVTTHFTEIKNFASATPGCENARMEFDAETLQPLYRLTIGEAGRSYAFAIAKKLGIPDAVTRRAEELTRRGSKEAGERDAAPAPMTVRAAGPARQTEGDAADDLLPKDADAADERQTKETAAQAASAAGLHTADGRQADAAGPGGCRPQTAERQAAPPDLPAEDPGLLPGASLRRAEPEPPARNTDANAGAEGDPEGSEPKPPAFRIGDSVSVPYLGKTGIVYSEEDGMGTIGVQIQGKKFRIARKRLQPHIPRESLYPEDYDLSIVLDSKENRKKRHKMERRHLEGVTIEQSPDERGDTWRR
ncbi:endonuclease MutS2 [Saccharibacillus alkalitolerans]|uniref:DNA mismatch repair protein MutS n=1 Tax=Saccharibacillus alkalitolerans TaxID=2705290 RepID=A0ABX0F4U4_9BACL|nr:DNA mismatch repair protein MutS [Saccharibacillus alkalitolerans]NGZ74910.1 DNA mismatch repair protein MutS [Saccharibacillus alkalitolerans]